MVEREQGAKNSMAGSGGNHSARSKGKGDGALEKASFRGRTEADAVNEAQKKVTQASPAGCDSTEDSNPYEHG
jgi:hypothetical protein